MPRTWLFPSTATSVRRTLSQALDLSELTAQVLANRGIDTVTSARSFLSPRLTDLHDPDAMQDMPRACERVAKAVRDRERIVVYGDYDVDGLAATALLVKLFELLRANARAFVPNRLTDSYSITPEGARRVIETGADLVIAVDNGTTAIEGVETLARSGIDVIVTDHHLPGPELPPAFAVVNPRRPDCPYPFKELSGVGVAFKLAWGVARILSQGTRVTARLREFLQYATAWTALGTVADVVPLVNENRVLVKYGLPLLAQAPSPGLRALCQTSRLGQTITAEDVGFRLAPRLNAAGRMGLTNLALDLLLADSDEKARPIALKLEELNEKRRAIEQAIVCEALEVVEHHHRDDAVLVLARENWHAGVIGVVASRLVEALGKPVFMISLSDGRGKGSARTVAGFHLHQALSRCDDLLLTYGGHAAAAGLELEAHRVPALRERLNEVARELSAEDLQPTLAIDAEIPLAAVTLRLLAELDRLAPFGEGNSPPVFASSTLKLVEPPRTVGTGGDHLQLRVAQGSTVMKAIAYGMGGRAAALTKASSLQLAYAPRIDAYRGNRAIELQVLDMRTEV
ncbi:MAG: single-stranded-DNA-specific exonuclease RecJ [Planctomycetota bacterium]